MGWEEEDGVWQTGEDRVDREMSRQGSTGGGGKDVERAGEGWGRR